MPGECIEAGSHDEPASEASKALNRLVQIPLQRFQFGVHVISINDLVIGDVPQNPYGQSTPLLYAATVLSYLAASHRSLACW